jgi:hypothetical protein
MTPDELRVLMEPVAVHLLGEPNRSCPTKTVKRWGSRGSFSVAIDKGTYFDDEA